MDSWALLFDIVLLLAASLLAGGLFSKLGQSPLVGYLLAGMLLGGPGSLHLIRSESAIEPIAELGVALLLFSLGLEFSLRRLRSLGGRSLFAGLLQIGCTTVLGGTIALLSGLGIAESLALGALISPSSTAVVLRVLMERGEMDTSHGRDSLAVLLVQDICVVPLAILLTLLGGTGSPGDVAVDIGRMLLLTLALVVGLLLVLNVFAVRALGTLTLERNRELTVLLAVVTGLGSAWAAHAAGISPALGAFLAGMFLGSSPFATQVRADVSSLRVLLLTLFFGAAGMVADPIWILSHLHLVLGVGLLLLVGKTAVTAGVMRAVGRPARVAIATAICLSQIGEFAFVLATVGVESGALSAGTRVLVVSVAIVTLIASPYLVPAAPKLAAALERLRRRAAPLGEGAPGAGHAPSPDVVIVGFGPAGQLAARPLVGRDARVTVLDLNQFGAKHARELGFHGEVGDALQVEVLEHIGIGTAKVVVVTPPSHATALTVLRHARRLAPNARLLVRSRHQRDSEELRSCGAHLVIGDEESVGEGLAENVLQCLDAAGRPSPPPPAADAAPPPTDPDAPNTTLPPPSASDPSRVG